MRNNTLKLGFILGIMIFGMAAAEAQVEKQIRHHKAYQLEAGLIVEITNKYGMVEVETWDKDSVSFDISLKASAKTEEKIEHLFEDIEFNFIRTESRIMAKTVIGDNRSQFLQEITNLATAITSLGVDAEINYKVKMPKNNPLRITNSFGDIFLDNMTEEVSIYISHGDLRAGNISKKMELDIRFGKAYLRDLAKARIKSKYSDLISIQSVGELTLISKSSVIDIGKITTLDMDSKSDRINIEELSRILGKASFSKLNIRKFKMEAKLDYKFGNINFDQILAGFKTLELQTNLTDISLSFETGTSYTFEMTTRQTELRIPDELKPKKKVVGSEKDQTYVYSGSYGTNSGRSRLIIHAEKGEIIIVQK